jgi:hypothetical protein
VWLRATRHGAVSAGIVTGEAMLLVPCCCWLCVLSSECESAVYVEL